MSTTDGPTRVRRIETPISLDAAQTSHLLDSLIEHLPAMVFVKEAANLRFVRFNHAGEQLLGITRDVLLGKNDYDLFPVSQADAFTQKDREVLASRFLHDIPQEPIETAHGTRWLHTLKIPILDAEGAARFLVGVSMDISEQKRAQEILRSTNEELERRVAARTAELEQQIEDLRKARDALARTEAQLLQAQKMEAIGRLAGGIAHDYNNVLSVVLGYAELVLQKMEPHDAQRGYVEEIERAAVRAAELTHQLLAVGRRQVLKPVHLDLNAVVLQIDRMLSRVLGEDIDMTFEPGRYLGTVEADRGQVEQVLMNLIVNARDALPRGGSLLLATENVEVDRQFAEAQLGATPGPYVRLRVQDSGVGMSEATLGQIFEPFFTTKELGKGTGLGLSTCLGIVDQNGGMLWVDSIVGKGSSFHVLLPVVQSDDQEQQEEADRTQPRGSETILFVEDEEMVRSIGVETLRDLGYTVHQAANGPDAMIFLSTYRGRMDILVTDVVMPHMSGRDLGERVVARRPGIRVLYTSGYTDSIISEHGILDPGITLLQKPYSPAALAQRVRAILDGTTDQTVTKEIV